MLFIFSTILTHRRNCSIDEAKNKGGPNRCRRNKHCNGDRTCSKFHWCQGHSHCYN